MEQKKKALGRGLEQLFDSEVLDFNSLLILTKIDFAIFIISPTLNLLVYLHSF